ncbi:acyltransferase [Acetivibrio cellulolyticus]|uniref:acyltransferase n=1 Tax=Acetivibrio cellulolyticus TaxID=35830 RepID=UPI0002481BAD|nr:acyltransferase family protein [Acetivibrio cellulolyticus]
MKRKTGLDLIRTFAIFFVVGVHFFFHTNFYKVPVAGKNMMAQVALRWFFTMCVPLFIMLTGYLQTEKKPEKKYFKKIIPILGVYLFYSVLSIFMRIMFLNENKSILKWIAEILVFSADKYSWYINMYIGLFLLTPFLNLIHKNLKDAKEYKIFLVILIFLTGLPSFFNSLATQNEIFNALSFSDWWTRIYPITYYFIGAYIKEYQVKLNKKLAMISLALIVLFETALTVFYSWNKAFVAVIGDYDSIFIMAGAVLFFLMFYDIKIENRHLSGLLGTISVLSLDIYLCSYISDKLVYRFVMKYIFKSQQQIMFYSLFVVMASFTLAFIVAYLRYKAVRIRPIQNSKFMKSISQ